jgi:apolipoprotein D and lipocalin family protein
MIFSMMVAFTHSAHLTSSVPPHPPVTVPYVDIEKYLGTWYEQAVIPYYFERDCTHTTATYSIYEPGVLRVNNTCLRKGKPFGSVGEAVPEDSTNAKLAVKFFPLAPSAQYWIVRLDEGYTYAAISDAKYEYLWILSRNRTMNPDLYTMVYNSLKKDGFPVDQLVHTDQS